MADKEGAKKVIGYSILMLGCGYFLVLVGPTRLLFPMLFYYVGITSMIFGAGGFLLAIASLFINPHEKISFGREQNTILCPYCQIPLEVSGKCPKCGIIHIVGRA